MNKAHIETRTMPIFVAPDEHSTSWLASVSLFHARAQVPKYRGTMMSMNSAAQSFGSALGTTLGGTALIIFNYEALGTILGALGIVAAAIFYLIATDPTGHQMQDN